MNRNPNDRQRSIGNGRVRAFVRQDRESGIHPAIVALHRRPHQRDGDDSRKTGEYFRIERGQEV